MLNILRIIAATLALTAPAFAQVQSTAATTLISAPEQTGGPVAVGQVSAQVDPQTGKVAIIQAPAAAEQSGGIIHLSAFGWLTPYFDTLAQALITFGIAWLGKSKYSQWLDQSGRDALEVFLRNRASSLIADGGVRMQGKAIHVDNNMLFRAASDASTAIPDALKRFKLTPDVVAAKIIDAIPQTNAGAAIIANAHTDDAGSAPVPVTDRPSAAPQVAAPNNPPTSAAS